MRKVIVTSLALATVLMAKPNVPIGDMKTKLAKMAGEKGVFAKYEVFPKDYFLISKNLPWLVGLTLHHPMSSTLGLSNEQIKKIKKIKATTIPTVIKAAKEIKTLELALSKMIDDGATDLQLNEAIDKIGALKIALTKKHLVCIKTTREILSEEQRKKVLVYAGKRMKAKASKHSVKELVPLPHFMQIIMKKGDVLKITDEQKQKLQKEIKDIFPEKIHGGMDRAKVIEDKIQNAVLKEGKIKEDVRVEVADLAVIKMLITNDHIDALNALRGILSQEQFNKVLELSKKKHKH